MKTLDRAIKALPIEADVVDKVKWFFNGDKNRLSYISVWVSSIVDPNIGSLPVSRVTVVVDSSKINRGFDCYEDEIDESVKQEFVGLFRRLNDFVRGFAYLDYPDSVEVKTWLDLRRTDLFLPRKYVTSLIDLVIATMAETIDEPALQEIIAGKATCVYRGKDAVVPNVVARIIPRVYTYHVDGDGSVKFSLPAPHSKGEQWSDQELAMATLKTVSSSRIEVFESVEDMKSWLDSITEHAAHSWEFLQPVWTSFRFWGGGKNIVCLPIVTYVDYKGDGIERTIEPISANSADFIEPIRYGERVND